MPGRFLLAMKPIAKFMPEVRSPERRVSFGEKIFWSGIAVVIYLIMAEVPLFGIPMSRGYDPLRYLRVIFASSHGTLMELGIGPIVTAGLILQLLAGSGMISVDFSRSDDRALFTSATKFFSLIMTLFNAAAYLIGGAYGTIRPEAAFFIFLQLLATGIILMLLDELIQKGWGIGSGISLFILAGVTQRILWSSLAPIPMSEDGRYLGALIAFGQALLAGASLQDSLHRPGNLPDMLGFIATISIFLIVIYLQGVRIELPISYARFRGFRGRYPIRLLYVSNIPVILAMALFANIYFLSQIIWNKFGGEAAPFWIKLIGTYSSAGRFPEPVSGLAYYVIPPRSLSAVVSDPLRAAVYATLLSIFCAVFAITWIEIGGLSPKTVAQQLLQAGMQIPGFRRSYKPIEGILKKYIPTVAILGGIIIGAVTAFADFLGAFGTGTGCLLTITILWQYYELLVRERISDMYPALSRFLGG